ncbi:B-cell receptor-associated protein 31 [Crotalus adamanteus]|uniref:Endoplasmic reticulum transmembrane protein n=7 Tax=Crotalinae TaxID=8710 RepID=A0AAW1BZI8_CROAD
MYENGDAQPRRKLRRSHASDPDGANLGLYPPPPLFRKLVRDWAEGAFRPRPIKGGRGFESSLFLSAAEPSAGGCWFWGLFVLSSCESQLFLEPFPSHTSMMSLQWAAVATFLYAEVLLVFLLCIPFISATRWQKIFKSRLVKLLVIYGNTFFVVLIIILVLLFLDAIREIRKYDDVTEKVNLQNNPGAVEHFHMKLFRAQRNLYIAGFSLLMAFLLRRLITLISQHATILASNEAFKKQAEGASDAAKKYMEENDKLKKELKLAGVEVADLDIKSIGAEEENLTLQAEVKKLQDELTSTKKALNKADNEALAMRKQAEGLTVEYDRLLKEHGKLQASCEGQKDKKDE